MKLTTRVATVTLLAISGAIRVLAQAPATLSPREQAWNILTAGVAENSVEKRSAAVRSLGMIGGDTRVRQMAERALGDREPRVRAAAATALGQIGSKQSISKLKNALADDDPSVVLASARALRILHDRAAYDVYYEILTGERKAKEGLMAQGRETLKDKKKMAVLGVEEGIGFLPFGGLGFFAVKTLATDDSSTIRAAAAEVLRDDPDPRTGAALVKASYDKSWMVRAAALGAIASRGDPRLLPRILPAMSDEKDAVRYSAAAAVIKLSQASHTKAAVHP